MGNKSSRFDHLFTPEKKAEYRKNLEDNVSYRGGIRGHIEITQEGQQEVDEIREYYETNDDPEYGYTAPRRANRSY